MYNASRILQYFGSHFSSWSVKINDFDYYSVNIEVGEFIKEVVEEIKESEEVEEIGIEENVTESENVPTNLITGAVTFLGEGNPITGVIIMVAIIFIGLFFYFVLNKK